MGCRWSSRAIEFNYIKVEDEKIRNSEENIESANLKTKTTAERAYAG